MQMFRKLVLAALAAGPVGVVAAGAAAGSFTFEREGLAIEVGVREPGYGESRSYQIAVSDALRVLARLEVNRDGLVTDAWLTDLDRDGHFEIVVATGQLDGTDKGAVDIHEWRDFRFETWRTAPLAPAEAAGYRGNDQIRLENGQLRREFPVFTDASAGQRPLPTGEMARFEYDAAAMRWRRTGR